MLYLIMKRGTVTDARKRFDPQLYAENDAIAKDFIKNLLKGTAYQAIDNPKKRGVDLLIYKDSVHICNIECEIKRVWKDSVFPYESVQIPVRKEKYAILELPTIFTMLNGTQSDYLCFTSQQMLASPKKEVPNKYVYKGEFFFQIDKNVVVFNDILKVLGNI